jgi:uncharacterized protein YuzE
MRLTYDSEANAAYFYIEDDAEEGSAVENVVVERPGLRRHRSRLDADGHLLGVDLIGATELLRTTVSTTPTKPDCCGLGPYLSAAL